jgi:ribosomal protein S13
MIIDSYFFFNSNLTLSRLSNLFFLVKLKTFNTQLPLHYFLSRIYSLSGGISASICFKFGVPLGLLTEHVLLKTYYGLLFFFKTYISLVMQKTLILEHKYLIKYQFFLNYRGFRHTRGLPVNGQRTCSNAKSCRSILFHNKVIGLIKKLNLTQLRA